MTKLFVIEGQWRLRSFGVILKPDLPIPPGGWKDCSVSVCIRYLDGQEQEACASFRMSHSNIQDPLARIERRWRISVTLAPEGQYPGLEGATLLIPDVLAEKIGISPMA